jgi:hypothetical protein
MKEDRNNYDDTANKDELTVFVIHDHRISQHWLHPSDQSI